MSYNKIKTLTLRYIAPEALSGPSRILIEPSGHPWLHTDFLTDKSPGKEISGVGIP